MPTRRDVLTAGTALAVPGAVATLSRPAAAYEVPSSVTISHDATTLERYRPLLKTSHLKIKPTAWYAWTARSPDRDTDAHVYWAEYPGQDGVFPSEFLVSDSHEGDHEPVIVYADADTGDIESVSMSVYHWINGRFDASQLPLDGDRPALMAARPWHHYQPDPNKGGRDIEIRDLQTEFDAWLDNGMRSAMFVESTTRPWTMRGSSGRGHYWSDLAAGFSPAASVAAGLGATTLFEGSYQ